MVSFTAAKILLIMITSSLVFGASTKVLDTATLLENGRAAQKLNAAYQNLKATDACIDGTKACLSGGVTSCRNGVWVAGQGACSTTQVWFALPSNQKAGTIVTCTTEKNALSVIEATGAPGGIFGNLTATDEFMPFSANITAASTAHDSDPINEPGRYTDTHYTDPSALSSDPTPSTVSTCTGMRSKAHFPMTISPSATFFGVVTQTITVGDEPTILRPVTRTLSPEKAFSLLAHFLANGATIVDGPSASVTSSFPASNITPSASTIKLL